MESTALSEARETDAEHKGIFFTTAEASQATGCSVRQLDYWADQGLAVPSIRKACGSGSRRLYSLDDLVQLRFILRLKHSGWSLKRVRQAVRVLREVHADPDPLKNSILVHEQGMLLVILKTKNGARYLIDALKSGGQTVMEIVLETLIQETVSTIKQQK